VHILIGIKWQWHVQNDKVRRTTKQPHLSGHSPSMTSLPVWEHCTNVRWSRRQEDLISFSHGKLEETTGTFLYNVVADHSAGSEM